MDTRTMKWVGLGCLIVCAVCIFVAIERYNANAGNVRAMNSLRQSTPLGDMIGGGTMKPATPAATKYALLFAGISGIGGALLLVKGGQKTSGREPDTHDAV